MARYSYLSTLRMQYLPEDFLGYTAPCHHMRYRIPVSYTSLSNMETCPWQWYRKTFGPLSEADTKISHSLFFGEKMHRFIEWMHTDMTPVDRPFLFTSLHKAWNAWDYMWSQFYLESAKDEYRFRTEDPDAEVYWGRKGQDMIARYWYDTEQYWHELRKDLGELPQPFPSGVEVSRTAQLQHVPVTISGKIDQERQLTRRQLQYLSRSCPDLFNADGTLRDAYAPVVLFDFKTQRPNLTSEYMKQHSGKKEELYEEFAETGWLQPALYTFLYEWNTGQQPVGFVWKHLASGTPFFVSSTDIDYRELEQSMNSYLSQLSAQEFEKRPGIPNPCTYCPFYLTSCDPFAELTETAVPPFPEVIRQHEAVLEGATPPSWWGVVSRLDTTIDLQAELQTHIVEERSETGIQESSLFDT